MKKLSAIILTLAILLTALSFTACGTSLDLKDYTTVEFSGVDGNATAKINFDFAAFEEAYSAANGSSDPFSQKALQNSMRLASFESTLEYEVSPAEGLSNGDEVEITFTYSKDAAKSAGVSLKNASYKLKVEDLTEAIEIDAFDPSFFNTETGVMVKYNDIFPQGYFSISNKLDKSNPAYQVDYSIDDSADPSYGETVTITASLPYGAEDEGYVLKEETYEFPLENIDHYLVSADEISAEDKAQIKQNVSDVFSAEHEAYGLINENRYDFSFESKHTNKSVDKFYLLKSRGGVYADKIIVACHESVDDIYHNEGGIVDQRGLSFDNILCYYELRNFYITADGHVAYDVDDIKYGLTDHYLTEQDAKINYLDGWIADYNLEEVAFD